MFREIVYFVINSIILFLVPLVISSCQTHDEKMMEVEYTIEPNSTFKIYGIEINNILSKNFSQIEKVLKAKTMTDEEVSVIFICIDKDFVLKTKGMNDIKDNVDILYGPVEDLSLYKKPGSVVPQSIIFYGKLSIDEPTDIKKTILEELAQNLPTNNAVKEILDELMHDFITGGYSEGRTLTINFDMKQYPIAYFYITFINKGEIIYRYTFSKEKEVYP